MAMNLTFKINTDEMAHIKSIISLCVFAIFMFGMSESKSIQDYACYQDRPIHEDDFCVSNQRATLTLVELCFFTV